MLYHLKLYQQLAKRGLTLVQLGVLETVDYVTESRGEPYTVRDLQETLRLSQPPAWQHIQRLLRAGLICEAGSVGAFKAYRATSKGKRLLASIGKAVGK